MSLQRHYNSNRETVREKNRRVRNAAIQATNKEFRFKKEALKRDVSALVCAALNVLDNDMDENDRLTVEVIYGAASSLEQKLT